MRENLLNLCNILKFSVVTPIRKLKRANKCEEIRPINNMCAIEIWMKKNLICVKNSKILLDEQSGYSENHSYETTLICSE